MSAPSGGGPKGPPPANAPAHSQPAPSAGREQRVAERLLQRQGQAMTLPAAGPTREPARVVSSDWPAQAAEQRRQQAARTHGTYAPAPGGSQFQMGPSGNRSVAVHHHKAVEAVRQRLAAEQQESGPPAPSRDAVVEAAPGGHRIRTARLPGQAVATGKTDVGIEP